MSDSWLVVKFGGTSVAGIQQWQAIESLVRQRLDNGYRVLLVCSAVSGITNSLQALVDSAQNFDVEIFESMIERYRQLARDLDVDANHLIQTAGAEIHRLLELISNCAAPADRYSAIASLMPIGEYLTTRIGQRFLARSLSVDWVDARQALTTLAEDDATGKRSRLFARCESGPDRKLQAGWSSKAPLLITQGFVASHPCGGPALLGRGGSDTSAALLASRLEAVRVEIWTDVPGLFSADPRVIPGACLLRVLNYDEALEMAASGTKVVHSRCIRAASDAGIPILVRDIANPGFEGTTIQGDTGTGSKNIAGIRAVCCQPDMAVLLLQNLDTREHVGFLAWVFTQFSEAGISVDLVATSETTTTVALDRARNHLDGDMLEKLATRLRQRCAVTVHPQCSAINLVGRGARLALAGIDPDASFFGGHPLLMLSQSANDLSISLLLHSRDAELLLPVLHAELVGKGLDAERRAKIFGPGWQEIQH